MREDDSMMANLRNLLILGSLALISACANDAYVHADDSSAEDAVHSGDDVQQALSALPAAQVALAGTAGVPSFINGVLGKVDSTDSLTADSADYRLSLNQILPAFRLTESDLQHKETTRDAAGSVHFRYNQVKNGLRVIGGDFLVHVNGTGEIYAAQGTRGGVSLSSVPALSATDAQGAALSASQKIQGAKAGQPELAYHVNDEGKFSLVWVVPVTGERDGVPVDDVAFVNAKNSNIEGRDSHVKTALNRAVYNLNHGTSLPGTLARSEGGAANSDSVVNDNYDRLGTVYNAYKTLFNRDSFDNAGAQLKSSVHYSSNYVNAYWNGTQMVYGDGDGVNASNLAVSLDVTGHELTHAVTERTAGLVYSGQSGGLNESTSDVLGNVVEWFRDGKVVSANTWMVGEDIWTPGTPNDALRYMNDPKKDGSSIDCFTQYTSSLDVHYSSGLPNLAFYLMSQGGKHPRTCSTFTVTGVGVEHASAIWYRALTTYWTSGTTFAQARTGIVQAATDLYGAAEANNVANAWAAVGVGSVVGGGTGGGGGSDGGTGGGSGGGTTDGGTGGGSTGGGSGGGSTGGGTGGGSTDIVLSNGVPATGLSGSLAQDLFYVINVPAGQSSLTITTGGGTGDADLYVKFGSRPTQTSYDCRPYAIGNVEKCTFANPAAGAYYVVVHGFDAFSGVSLTGTYAATTSDVPVITNGVPVTNISGASNSFQTWKITVPAGTTSTLKIAISGGLGDADLYVRKGAKPTTAVYDCRPYKAGNKESCSFTAPSGDYYISLRGYSAFSGVQLVGTY